MAVFTAIATAATSAALSLGISTVAAVGIGMAVARLALGAVSLFVANAIFRARLPAFENGQSQNQAVINQATAARRRGYGQARLGGVRAFFDSNGDGVLFQAIMLHQGRIEAIDALYIGDTPVSLNANAEVQQEPWWRGNIEGVQGSYAHIRTYLGDDSQAMDPVLGGLPQWTADHRLRGIAYLVVWFLSPPAERYLEVFPQGSNTPVTAVCRLSRVLDTRTGTTAWSDNPALCLADYLTHPDGYGRLTYADLDTASWNAMANICDELVALAAGGTERRYRLWGLYNLTDRPADVVETMLAVCDGELFTTREGKIGIRGGKWDTPAVTIMADDILGHDMEQGADALERFNQLKVVYTDPAQSYQPTEAAPWDDLADQAERGVLSEQMTVEMCPSPSQARRLAKIRMARSNPRWRGRIRTNLVGLKARGERTVRLVLPELNIDGSFLVGSHELLLDQGIPVACEMQVISMTADAYAWDAATEEGQSPPTPQDTAPDGTLPTPQNIVLAQEARSGIQVVTATCDAPTRPDAQLEAQITVASLLAWETMSVASGALQAVSGALSPEDYLVRLRFRFGGAVGGWTTPAQITVT